MHDCGVVLPKTGEGPQLSRTDRVTANSPLPSTLSHSLSKAWPHLALHQWKKNKHQQHKKQSGHLQPAQPQLESKQGA